MASPAGAAVQDRPRAPATVGIRWPVAAEALEALVDMGMSDEAVGRYFGVSAADVAQLRATYRIGSTA